MIAFLTDNLATILVGIAVLAVLALAFGVMIRDRKKAARSSGCTGGCCGCCPHSGSCHGGK